MTNLVDENPQVLVTDNEQPQRSSPTRVAASHSDLELMERSQAFLAILDQLDCMSNTNLPVLLIGEPGPGKQWVACTIHQHSPRSHQPFIAANCATFAADALAAELFGIDQDRPGLWAQANGGTLFLDEITETDCAFQTKLLDVMQTGELRRAESDEVRKLNVRVIAGSSRNVEEEVAAGRFREDLFHAFGATSIVLPPIRTIQSAQRDQLAQPTTFDPSVELQRWVTLSEVEGRYVARVLEHTRGNKQAAARVLQVDRKTLDRMIKRHHIVYPYARHRAKAS